MVNLHPSLEIVYAVVEAIPAPIDAKPGDEIIFRPSDPDFPIVVRRTLPMELAPLINERSLKMLHAEPAVGEPVSPVLNLHRRAHEPATLRQVG